LQRQPEVIDMAYRGSNGKLNAEQRIYLITRLAAADRPSAIAGDLKAKFGVSITRQGVQHDHPDRSAGVHLARPCKVLFRASRLALAAGAGAAPRAGAFG
jgi:hypothetical protein